MSTEWNAEQTHRLDGNAAAGLLGEIFNLEMTTAICTCANCGNVGAIGELMLYGGEMGKVLRCPACESLVICITHHPSGYWMDFRGATVLRVVEAG
jgi:hypothetical protein